jgi:hypothetical protein
MVKKYRGSKAAFTGRYGAFDHTMNVVQIPSSATADTERETLATGLKCSSPIEMKNDQKERHGYSTIAAIMMMWAEVPKDDTPELNEQTRIVITEDSSEYLIRKVKRWPHVNPFFYELHVEDET